jgi:hypothetical protein
MVLIALVAACTSPTSPEAPAVEAEERAAGPAFLLPLVLQSGPWVSTLPVDLTVTGAPPNTRVYFLASVDVVGPALCPPQTAPLCLELSNPVLLLGSDVSDASGLSAISPTVPNPPAGVEVEIQAVITGANPAVSNALIEVWHDDTSDFDGDGLNAEDEVVLGTDPETADSDGDRFADGVEVEAATDPLDAGDFPLTYTDDVYPLFQVECAGCHTGGGNSGGFNLDDYVDVVNEPSNDVPGMDRIEPFDPDDSYLFHKLNDTQLTVGGSGLRMPRSGPALTVDEKALVETWIIQGALE